MKFVPTGSTLLNLVCSGRTDGGYRAGRMLNIIGDSSSGKTFLALTMLAEACYCKSFSKYKLYFDDVEASNNFDLVKLFGKQVAERIVSPYADDMASDTIEDFYYTVDTLLNGKDPFIYILDSMDGLTSVQEQEKFDENKTLYLNGKDQKGSYSDGKAKKNSENLRKLVRRIEKSDSLLLIISQTRDNLTASFAPKTRSAGKALKFYATYEMWLANVGLLKQSVRGKDRVVGIQSRIKFTKNKVTGKYSEIDLPIYYQYGVDDLGSLIDFLVEEKVWTKPKGSSLIESPEFEMKKSRNDWISYIEDNNLEQDIKDTVADVWNEIEKGCVPDRKKKFQ